MPNALAHAKSPYLRAHADNPVAWREWDAAALDWARGEDRPLFVSVGYMACHWCHVMAREAFSDPEVARILNEHFVSIKVDREERPDLDQVLQVAHQALNGRGGGWPLSVFMEPRALTPFFVGTYFPLTPRYGMPGFADLLERVLAAWCDRREAVQEQGQRLRELLVERLGRDESSETTLSKAPVQAAHAAFLSAFDGVHGGFGDAPKFPRAPALSLLAAQDDADALPRTLAAMARGGLNDHVGGGFFRYAVDAAWRVPHFEKMLADNAQLLGVYAEAALSYDSEAFRRVALATARFMGTKLALPTGGYASSLNAEAGGEEGGFYLWDREEVRELLGDKRYPAFAAAFGLEDPPLIEGRWHLARVDEGEGDFADELAVLAKARAARAHPERDDKRLTSLNALAVTSLARASQLLDVAALGTRAAEGFRALESSAIEGDQVYACVLDGEAYQPGFLADYACLAEAALALAAIRPGDAYIERAVQLKDTFLARFRTEGGGLAITGAESGTLLYRPRDYSDSAVPAGAGVAVRVLTALGHLLAEPEYLDGAESVLRAAWREIERAPMAHPTLLTALAEHLDPPPLVVLRGDERIGEWARAATHHQPQARIIRLAERSSRPALLRYAARGKAVAYVCRGTACSAPIDNQTDLLEALK
jgi:uncharacterized protein YyaL (SSP411 family)